MVAQQAVAVRCWDHSVVPVMDLWRAEQFYTELLDAAMFAKVGMTYEWAAGAQGTGNLGTFIKLGRSHLGLFLQNKTKVYPPADLESGYPCWGLGMAEDDFAAMVAGLRASGVEVGPERELVLGDERRRSVRFVDTEGNCLELAADARGRYDGSRVTELSHIHFEALDLAATAAFYPRYLGLTLVDGSADELVLGLASGQHLIFHRVAELSPASVGPYRGRHFAFHVTHESFRAIVERLRESGIPEQDIPVPRTSEEQETYFYDPDGHWLQITTEDSAAALQKSGRRRLRYVPA